MHESDDHSDAWRDDESLASTDFSSYPGDTESDWDFEFLSRSSSQIPTEEEVDADETDTDDITSIRSTDAVASTPSIDARSEVSATGSASIDFGELQNSVDESTELLSPARDVNALDDSTATIISRERRDTITPASSASSPVKPIASNGKPFSILYAGSPLMKSNVLRKLGQALMAAALSEKSTSSTTDWSSGYTSVVPITDFNSAAAVPEVEFVEDSLVKIKVQELSYLNNHEFGFHRHRGYPREVRFQAEVTDTEPHFISCRHHSCDIDSCAWTENPETTPSLLAYCSPIRGEKASVKLSTVRDFAFSHHIPFLVISDTEIQDSANPRYRRNPRLAVASDIFTPKEFFDFNSTSLGLSLWKNAAESREIIAARKKNTEGKLFKLAFRKRIILRTAATVALVLLVLFFNVPLFSFKATVKAPAQRPEYPLAKTPSHKDVGTKYGSRSDIISLPPVLPATVTVTEQLIVTQIQTQTQTVTTTSRATSTIVLQAITSSVNVPKASITPRHPDIDYGYAFGYDDDETCMYLETERSVLLRLPGAYRESIISRPHLYIQVIRDGEPVPSQAHEWKKNDLIFIEWLPEEMFGKLQISVWTNKQPFINEQIIVDYDNPVIDPKYWQILEDSPQLAWNKLKEMGEAVDANFKSFTKDFLDPTLFHGIKGEMAEFINKAREWEELARETAEQHFEDFKDHFEDFKDKYPRLFTLPTDHDFKSLSEYAQKVHKQFDDYVQLAQQNALKLSSSFQDRFFKEQRYMPIPFHRQKFRERWAHQRYGGAKWRKHGKLS